MPVHVADKKTDLEKSPSAFKTISEVAEDLGVPAHVLRFWEQKFPHIQPLKRRGGRRYYRPQDIDALRHIQKLLYEEGYTIKGATKLFVRKPVETPPPQVEEITRELSAISRQAQKADKQKLQALLQSLKEMRALLKDAA
jgi:DNA-binding transcriptional MerR regulator